MIRSLSAGDAIPGDSHVIEVRVSELRQLFNAIDPSPFRERDLDPRAEEFIVEWARDLPATRDWPCGCTSNVHLAGQTRPPCSRTRFISTSRRAPPIPRSGGRRRRARQVQRRSLRERVRGFVRIW